jgi:hypothetical protein
MVQAGPGIRLIQKIPKAKRVGDIAQVVACLPGKYKTLSSNPSSTGKKKKL